ncbi:MAG: hypothetical protein EOO50_13735 [Flavobacterium sp.]|uniref:hypothetical protein n=1 Tax=Flavobacterium sp. TaxID=239 RepID=UPI00121BA773|nr:hypothetical protein [Flavobacterium sp.]RZJ65444.1 MAG: hypothetical protein EOO50_13735 [Flavobacterium sp.]
MVILLSLVSCAQDNSRKGGFNSWDAQNLLGEVRQLTMTTFAAEVVGLQRHTSNTLSSVTFKFDKKGFEEVMECYDQDGKLAIVSTPQYRNGVVSGTISKDLTGKTTEIWTITKTHDNFFAEEMHSTKDGKPYQKAVNSFDDKGRISKIEVRDADGSLSMRIERDYYDSGDMKSERITYPDRTTLSKFTYVNHDKLGNWTERLDDVDGNIQLTKRAIAYY